MKKLTFLFIFTLSIGLFQQGMAQKRKYAKPIDNRFTATAILGASVTQINGDESRGFNRQGIYGGLRGSVIFSHKLHFNIELLYSQKGSRLDRNATYKPGIKEFIKADYMEVPFIFKSFLKGESKGLYLEGGCSFARNIRLTIDQYQIDPQQFVNYETIIPHFNKNDFTVIAGFGGDFLEHFGLGFRYWLSMMPLYNNPNFEAFSAVSDLPEPIFRLRNYGISLFTVYRF